MWLVIFKVEYDKAPMEVKKLLYKTKKQALAAIDEWQGKESYINHASYEYIAGG